jgi:hypothetical protein
MNGPQLKLTKIPINGTTRYVGDSQVTVTLSPEAKALHAGLTARQTIQPSDASLALAHVPIVTITTKKPANPAPLQAQQVIIASHPVIGGVVQPVASRTTIETHIGSLAGPGRDEDFKGVVAKPVKRTIKHSVG